MRAEMGKDPTRAPPSQLNLPPGFRFYPTDEELVVHYLCKKAACEPFAVPVIAEVELYKFDPWDLPERALFGEKEWYFFSPRDRKYPNGSRPNRAAGTGYWKATGTDKPINTMGDSKKVGVKKALVFYKGKAPKGVKTNWIMHEYRLADGAGGGRCTAKRKGSLRLDDWVLCRIYKKSSSAASVQVKGTVGAAVAGIKAEQSESSCLDDVLASLSDQLDDQVEDQIEDAHTVLVGADNQEAASFHSGHGKSSSDLRAFMRQLQEKAGTVDQFQGQEGSSLMRARADQLVNIESSNLSSIEHSPLEYSTTSKEEEDMAVESTFNSLAGLPLTQLLNTSINTSNLSYSSNLFYGLDLGLPSPCSMLASGAPSYGGSLIDPDSGFFQPSQLGWEPSSINRINFPS